MSDGDISSKDEAMSLAGVTRNYPTEDAYLAACRALHWHTAQLRAHGIEPDPIAPDAPHYPPEGHVFTSQVPAPVASNIDRIARAYDQGLEDAACMIEETRSWGLNVSQNRVTVRFARHLANTARMAKIEKMPQFYREAKLDELGSI